LTDNLYEEILDGKYNTNLWEISRIERDTYNQTVFTYVGKQGKPQQGVYWQRNLDQLESGEAFGDDLYGEILD